MCCGLLTGTPLILGVGVFLSSNGQCGAKSPYLGNLPGAWWHFENIHAVSRFAEQTISWAVALFPTSFLGECKAAEAHA